MKIAYFDCFSGVSGDMILGAMIDAGLKVQSLQKALGKLKLPGCVIETRRVRRAGLSGTKVNVINRRNLPPFTTFAQIENHLLKSDLPKGIQDQSVEIFKRLARAEAEAHRKRIDQTHLHEVGAIDTLIDVVGAVIGISLLKIDRVIASPIHVGSGVVETESGVLPVPAPATALLLKGCPIYATGAPGELTTPTGAAILTTLASEFTPLPLMTVEKIGSGAGDAERAHPNLLRLFIGTSANLYLDDEVVQVETNIDDMNPQLYEHVIGALFSAGALDVFLTPIIMKRGRPAILLTVLVSPLSLNGVTDILFAETTTLGVRIQKIERKKLERKVSQRKTRYGSLQVKTVFQNGRPVRRRPEFRDVQRIAKKEGRPLQTLLDEINRTL